MFQLYDKIILTPSNTKTDFFFQTYYLEEVESLVDELLFRVNALSDSLHHTLPPKSHRYREDSPAASPVPEPSNMDSQVNQQICAYYYTKSHHVLFKKLFKLCMI